MRPERARLAVVIPVFNEERIVPELTRRLAAVFDAHPADDWHAWLVDDGSRDGTAALVTELSIRDPRFSLLQLSRNFGHSAAIAAGLQAAEGTCEACLLMDGDLQDPPELLPELVAAWRRGGEVVIAQRRSRAESWPRRQATGLFHRAFRSLADVAVPPDSGTFGLLAAEPLHHLNSLPERDRFFPGLRAWVGFRQTVVAYDRNDRLTGSPRQTLRRLIRYALDGLLGFSRIPLRLTAYFGFVASGIGFALAVFYAIKRLLGLESAEMGFTTLVTLVLFMGGIQLIALGVLGEYLGRVYEEVKRRPLYIVRRSPPPPPPSL